MDERSLIGTIILIVNENFNKCKMTEKHILRNNSSDWWIGLSTEEQNFYKDNLFENYKFITMVNIVSAYELVHTIEKYYGKEEVAWRVVGFSNLLSL